MMTLELKTGDGIRNGSGVEDAEGDKAHVMRIEETVAYMRQNLDRPLQVATLAAKANFSTSHFFMLFKRRVGSAPIDYFIRLRMQRACGLLCETNLSVKEVAAKLGYDDPFYFSRVFKSVNHLAPSDYRAAQRKNQCPTGAFDENPRISPGPDSPVSRRVQFA